MIQLNYLNESFAKLPLDWQEILTNNLQSELEAIDRQLIVTNQSYTIYPPRQYIFEALNTSNPHNISVVILGQDPYHGENEANGLAFTVNPHVKTPPSLRNILLELGNEYGVPSASLNRNILMTWPKQGVVLLNTTLTVIKDKANSLANIGWNYITDYIIQQISRLNNNVVFLLWGAFARSKKYLINPKHHLILYAPHPSPLSAYRGFFGCNHFIQANQYLVQHNQTPIYWIPENLR